MTIIPPYLDRHLYRAIIILIALLAWTTPNHAGDTLKHENGLTAPLPEGYEAIIGEAGFFFSQIGSLRYNRTISVTRTAVKPSVKPDDGEVTSSGRRYFIQSLGGGSGGIEYRLIAWKKVSDGWILVEAYDQVEIFSPNFDLAWTVLRKARVDKR